MPKDDDLFEKIGEELKKAHLTELNSYDDFRKAANITNKATEQFYEGQPLYRRIRYKISRLLQRYADFILYISTPPNARRF